MALGKWIGGFLGFIYGGPLGAIAGIVLGSFFDSAVSSLDATTDASGAYRPYDGGGMGSSQRARTTQQAYEGQRNSFLFSLLVLASYIIRADGKIMHSEMEYVRSFLRNNFGAAAVSQGEDILLKLFEEQKRQEAVSGKGSFRQTIKMSCAQIAANMDYSQRLQLLNFLVMIARADGNVSTEEVEALREVAQYLGLSATDFDSMFNLESDTLEAAYKVLGISPTATNDEVKAAYRQMALKHHPDRVESLGEDVRQAAEKKFQEINRAKERIYKARGL